MGGGLKLKGMDGGVKKRVDSGRFSWSNDGLPGLLARRKKKVKKDEKKLAEAAAVALSEGSSGTKADEKAPKVILAPAKTAAELRFEEMQRKRVSLFHIFIWNGDLLTDCAVSQQMDRVTKMATKAHKDRVAEYNEKLEKIPEHYDIPWVDDKGVRRTVYLRNCEYCTGRSDPAKSLEVAHTLFRFLSFSPISQSYYRATATSAPSSSPLSDYRAWKPNLPSRHQSTPLCCYQLPLVSAQVERVRRRHYSLRNRAGCQNWIAMNWIMELTGINRDFAIQVDSFLFSDCPEASTVSKASPIVQHEGVWDVDRSRYMTAGRFGGVNRIKELPGMSTSQNKVNERRKPLNDVPVLTPAVDEHLRFDMLPGR